MKQIQPTELFVISPIRAGSWLDFIKTALSIECEMYSQKALFVTLLTTPSPSTRITNPTKIYFPCATESLCVLLLISHEKPWYARALGAIGSRGMRGLDTLCNSRRWGRGAFLAVDRSRCWCGRRRRRGVTQRAGLGSGFLPSRFFSTHVPGKAAELV